MPGKKREFAFLSYAHNDLDQVRRVYDGLKRRKVDVWFDKEDVKSGRWKPQILKAITHSKTFIFCLSNAATKRTGLENSSFVDKELQTAWELASEQDERCFTIVPVRLEDCDRGDMRLTGWQQYDLFEDWEKGLDKLAVDIGGISLADATSRDERTENEKMVARLMGKSYVFFLSKDFDKALSILEAVTTIKPDSFGTWSNKGVVLSALGRHGEALEAVNKAIKIKPDHASIWVIKGNTFTDLYRYEEALEAYNRAIEIKPDYADTWFNKGNTLIKLGRLEEALEAYNKAIEIKPDYAGAWVNKGNTFTNLYRYEEALEAYNKAIEIEPDFYEGWYNLACCYSKMKDKTNALNCIRKAIKFGFNDLSHVKMDTYLDYVRHEPEFKAIIANVKRGKN